MKDIDQVTLKKIVTLLNVIKESELNTKQNIEAKYLSAETKFHETLNFLININLVQKNNNRLELSSNIKDNYSNELINSLIRKKNIFTSLVQEYLSLFHLKNDYLEFNPTIEQRLKYSNLRNLLIELGIIIFSGNNFYNISIEYNDLLFKKSKHIITQKEFDKYLESCKKIGFEAELFVLKLEQEKLKASPLLEDMIEHVSVNNVSAGYDIKSFNISKEQIPQEKFIEVKAVSRIDWHFNWSSNEISVAQKLGKDYYLYLVPVENKVIFNSQNIRIIVDPYKNLINSDEWVSECNSKSFTLVEKSN